MSNSEKYLLISECGSTEELFRASSLWRKLCYAKKTGTWIQGKSTCHSPAPAWSSLGGNGRTGAVNVIKNWKLHPIIMGPISYPVWWGICNPSDYPAAKPVAPPFEICQNWVYIQKYNNNKISNLHNKECISKNVEIFIIYSYKFYIIKRSRGYLKDIAPERMLRKH